MITLAKKTILLLFLCTFLVSTQAVALNISGALTTGSLPVQNASITFIDNSDTTIQYSALTDQAGYYSISIITAVNERDIQPTDFRLEQNYPNPFSSTTAIAFQLAKPANTDIIIYDVLGREVKRFSIGARPAGSYQVVWDGLNKCGVQVATGIYFYRILAGGETQVRKMIYSPAAGALASAFQPVSPRGPALFKGKATVHEQLDFTVKIGNTENTTPEIVPTQFSNVSVLNDTTLDFTVVKYTDPYAATIYPDSTRQIIRGFGAANILPWRPDMTADQITTAFGTDDGQIGLSILRLRLPQNTNEFNSNVATAKAAYDMGVTIIASPWSPPASMKTNNNSVGGRLKEDSYADFAAHLKSFVDYMADNDVPLYAVSVQNEPDVSVSYESCDWNADEMYKFVKENGADVGTKLIAPESYHFDHSMSDPILNDPEAAANLDIVGGHIYGGGLASYPLAESKGKEIWMTEHLDTDTSWRHVLATGKDINDCMKYGMSAYIWWYIVRFYGPVDEDGTVSKRGYVMSQYARFIRPGYHRVTATAVPQGQVYVTAYTGEDKVVIVAINQRSQAVDQTFILDHGDFNSFIPYVTSETKDAARQDNISVTGDQFKVTLPASSVTTLVSE